METKAVENAIEVKPESTPEYNRVESRGLIAAAIQAQVEEEDEAPHCYICMDSTNGEDNSPMELIAPCSCYTYVHRKCLDHWRVTSLTYNCMTHCPTCRSKYEFEDISSTNPQDIKTKIFRAKLWRAFIVLLVVVVGSMIIALIDAGTPKFFNLHWNALDGKIYDWVGLTKVPRFVIYFLLSLAMTAIITCLVFIVHWCWTSGACHACCDACTNCNCYCDTGYHHGGCCDCGGCDCGGCDCGDCGGEFAIVVVGVIVVCAIVAGLVLLFVGIVGGIGSVVDRRGERRIRTLQVQQARIKNLRPLSSV
ncbi:unnamed protein product [Aphanomyces euteiches]|uniref:Uncharacterized protein n=1 Tax=Aphanomyces euteiches TaxID=100861 RepID=A0A6G0WFA2_9STRA|nr:hypothetical protein Ae201684_015615 [Aphanomyces euteiches]KAH9084060.1 hypothetical protein Ae201684P_020321 [Aphanomyces euteiches]KAH9153731.1 hypothetical protein AeRB84_004075 [Aphanomyces euteiches]